MIWNIGNYFSGNPVGLQCFSFHKKTENKIFIYFTAAIALMKRIIKNILVQKNPCNDLENKYLEISTILFLQGILGNFSSKHFDKSKARGQQIVITSLILRN